MEVDEIIRLIETLSKKNIAEFELEKGGVRLRISKRMRDIETAYMTKPLEQNAYERPQILVEMETPPEKKDEKPATAMKNSETPTVPAKVEEPRKDLHYLKSPIVGTFYRAPKPNAEPYAKPGDRIKKGAVLCIIEAMKLMNEIESDIEGEIVEICIENGRPVEYGEPLFGILPATRAAVNPSESHAARAQTS